MAVVGIELAKNLATNPRGATASSTPAVIRRNLATNPSVEVDLDGYTFAAGTGGVAAAIRNGAAPRWAGSYGYRVTWTTGTTAASGSIRYGGTGNTGIPVIPAFPYSVSWFVKANKNQRLQMEIRWYTSADVYISSVNGTAILVDAVGTIARLQVAAAVPPVNATRMRVYINVVSGTGAVNWAAGDWIQADSILIEQTTKVLDFFDDRHSWFGVPSRDADGTSILTSDFATVRLNLAFNPSAENVENPHTVSWGTVGALMVRDDTRAVYGSQAFQVSRASSAAGTSGFGWQVFLDTAAPGEEFTFSAYVWSATTRDVTTHAQAIHIDQVNTEVGGWGNSTIGATKTLVGGEWTRISFTASVPSTQPANKLYLGFRFADTLTAPVWVDGVLIEPGSNLDPYFDGDTLSEGSERHEWGIASAVGYVEYPHASLARRSAARPAGYVSLSGAEFYQYATGGVGVIGTRTQTNGNGSGVRAIVPAVGSTDAKVVVKVQAIDALTVQALSQSVALAAGEAREITGTLAPNGDGNYYVSITQFNGTPKRWVVLGVAVVPDTAYAGGYFDGSTVSADPERRHAWLGLADASVSVWEHLPAPALTAVVDLEFKGVQLLAEGLATVDRVTIRRTAAGYEPKLVRAARSALAVGGTLLVFDIEAPLGVESTYQVQGRYPDGTLSVWSAAVGVTVPVENGEVWLKDVGQPLRSARITLRRLGGRRRRSRSEVHDVQDAEFPIVVAEKRASAVEQVVIGTSTSGQRERLDALLDSGQVLFLQVPPGWGRLDSFVSVGDSNEQRLRQWGPHPYRDWETTITDVAEPGSDRTGNPGSSYAVLRSTFGSYGAVMAERPSYLSVLAGSSQVR